MEDLGNLVTDYPSPPQFLTGRSIFGLPRLVSLSFSSQTPPRPLFPLRVNGGRVDETLSGLPSPTSPQLTWQKACWWSRWLASAPPSRAGTSSRPSLLSAALSKQPAPSIPRSGSVAFPPRHVTWPPSISWPSAALARAPAVREPPSQQRLWGRSSWSCPPLPLPSSLIGSRGMLCEQGLGGTLRKRSGAFALLPKAGRSSAGEASSAVQLVNVKKGFFLSLVAGFPNDRSVPCFCCNPKRRLKN